MNIYNYYMSIKINKNGKGIVKIIKHFKVLAICQVLY